MFVCKAIDKEGITKVEYIATRPILWCRWPKSRKTPLPPLMPRCHCCCPAAVAAAAPPPSPLLPHTATVAAAPPPPPLLPCRRHCPTTVAAAPLPPPLPHYCSCCCHRHWLLSSVVVSRCDWLSWLVGGHGRWSWPSVVVAIGGHGRR